MTLQRIEDETTHPYISANDGGNRTAFPVGTSSLIMQRDPSNIGAGKIFQITAPGFNLGFLRTSLENITVETDDELFEILETLLFSKTLAQ